MFFVANTVENHTRGKVSIFLIEVFIIGSYFVLMARHSVPDTTYKEMFQLTDIHIDIMVEYCVPKDIVITW